MEKVVKILVVCGLILLIAAPFLLIGFFFLSAYMVQIVGICASGETASSIQSCDNSFWGKAYSLGLGPMTLLLMGFIVWVPVMLLLWVILVVFTVLLYRQWFRVSSNFQTDHKLNEQVEENPFKKRTSYRQSLSEVLLNRSENL